MKKHSRMLFWIISSFRSLALAVCLSLIFPPILAAAESVSDGAKAPAVKSKSGSMPVAKVGEAGQWPKSRPKLVVFIVIDQFRADYLSRFGDRFGQDGFRALMKLGAYFPYGEYDILQSMTGPGHATVLTGSYPYQMGIPLNTWFDQKKQSMQYCVEDSDYLTVGAPQRQHVGTSPRNLVGSTVGDELKNAGLNARMFSLALKDRAAILMGGHRADLAFWFDSEAKTWVSSQYYLKNGKLPEWIQTFNSNEQKQFKDCDLATPCGIDKTARAFEAGFKSQNWGQTSAMDLVAVSFSSHDYAGHKYGPNAPIMEEMTLAEDRAIASVRKLVASKVPGGLKNVLFVLTGDHGVAPSPDFLKDSGIESGKIDEEALASQMDTELNAKCGKPSVKTNSANKDLIGSGIRSDSGSGAGVPKWIQYVDEFNFYLNESAIPNSKCDLVTAESVMKKVVLSDTGFAQAFTRGEYDLHLLPPGQFARQIQKTFYRGRSGNVVGIQKPFYINVSRNNANHMTGYVYDRMVPIIFSGFGINSGVYADKAEVVDIASTLSFIYGTLPPALSEGKVLKQALKQVN